MLGTACGTLAVAAVVSAVHPVPGPVLASDAATAGDRDVHALGDAWAPVDESEPVGGPLEIPEIGVVLENYDERYAALAAARVAQKARADDVPAPSSNPDEALPAPPAPPPADEPSVAQPPATPPASPTTPSPTTTPATPPPTPPPSPTTMSQTTTPPAEQPPAEQPPAEELPVEEPPVDTTLALGQRHEYPGADGNVELTITLVSVSVDQACTAGSLPAENGHLIGLDLEVVDPDPPIAGEQPSVSAADFRFHDADDVAMADVDTAAAAACLADGWPAGRPGPDGPVEGTVVLDVPAVTGTIVYRPEGRMPGLRWRLAAAR